MDARIGLGLAAAFVAGLAGAAMLAGGRGGGERAAAGADFDGAALLAELRALTRTQEQSLEALERLAQLAEDGALAGGEQRTARAPVQAPLADGELLAALEELRLTVETELARTRAHIADTPGLGGESLSEARRRIVVADWPALELLEERWREDPEQANRSQYLQTTRDLLETYGPRTDIYRPSGGMLFRYRRAAPGAPGSSWTFRLQDGMVVEFFLEDEPEDAAEGG